MRMVRYHAWTGTALGAAVTAIAVPTGVAVSGLGITAAGTASLAATLAVLVLAARRWPLAGLVLSVTVTVGYRTADLADAGWVWPATVAFAAAVLAGRTGWAAAIGAVTV